MTADKMFEKLGYKITERDNDSIVYEDKEVAQAITFYLDRKTVSKYENTEFICVTGEITIPELKAINEKVKELGWYD